MFSEVIQIHTHTHICCFSCSVVTNSLETPWTVVSQAPLSMGLFRQGHWNGLPFPSPGDFWPRGWTRTSCREALSPPVPGQGGYPHLTSSSSPSSPWPHISALPTALYLRAAVKLLLCQVWDDPWRKTRHLRSRLGGNDPLEELRMFSVPQEFS